jgi:predicted transcriptional regulator
MVRKSSPLPTEGELRILEVLWDRGACTVREVHEIVNRSRRTGHTTVLKLMQIMAEKGSVIVDRSTRPQTYRAAEPQGKIQRNLVGDLLDRAFSGSPGPLVLQALSAKRATPEERRQIREMLDRLETEDAE